MPSNKRRINLTVSEKTESLLKQIAEQEGTSVTTVALDLLTRALELREDEWLLTLAQEREKTKIRPLTDKQIWR